MTFIFNVIGKKVIMKNTIDQKLLDRITIKKTGIGIGIGKKIKKILFLSPPTKENIKQLKKFNIEVITKENYEVKNFDIIIVNKSLIGILNSIKALGIGYKELEDDIQILINKESEKKLSIKAFVLKRIIEELQTDEKYVSSIIYSFFSAMEGIERDGFTIATIKTIAKDRVNKGREPIPGIKVIKFREGDSYSDYLKLLNKKTKIAIFISNEGLITKKDGKVYTLFITKEYLNKINLEKIFPKYFENSFKSKEVKTFKNNTMMIQFNHTVWKNEILPILKEIFK